MQPLSHQEAMEVEIDWKRPKEYARLLQEGSEHDENAKLYLITARYSKADSKVIYIGMTYAQQVSRRLAQADQKKHHAAFEKEYPRHKFFVSHGVINILSGNLTQKRLDDIKRILVYTNEPEHAHNVQNLYKHGVTGSYRIKNKGSKGTLPRLISLGIFISH